ncbi:MAG: phosphoenolpyruvate carboxykinase (ATP) [Candidatus Kapaibacterium sp.]
MKSFDKETIIEPGMEYLGLRNLGEVHWHHTTAVLYEHAIKNSEGIISHQGPLCVKTGKITGRSPNDKFIVKDDFTENTINWGKINRPYDEKKFDILFERVKAHLQTRDIYVQDVYSGSDSATRMKIRIITRYAWQSLFARNLFIRELDRDKLKDFTPDFTVIDIPNFLGNPELDDLNSETFICVNFKKKLVLIGGTQYAGEIKKSIFSVMNYFLPLKGVLGMHCSSNKGPNDDVALLFGLSGTGKTTLSADPKRALIGDDEHGWNDEGIFNFEGGCYAKVINLSKEAEPEIWATTRKFGTILENVVIDEEIRRPDLHDNSLTENTRAAYPIMSLDNIVPEGKGGHPNNIIFLTADAFGVLPPISRLTPEQAMYHFLLGYTAKVAGTEKGVTEPQATFSTCFGAPFMPLHPSKYAELLGKKIRKHNSRTWLVNTGWVEGPYGEGHRISIKHTRALLNAALEGNLDNVEYETDPIFGLQVPKECPDVPSEILMPKNTWKDKNAYDEKAKNLAAMFKENFKQYERFVDDKVIKSGPIA